jgi:hypothetical protein
MTPLARLRALPVTLRVPLVTAALMIVLGLVASQGVLAALGRVQDARLSETARLHVEGLSVALGPSVLRQDVWEVYDTLDRARSLRRAAPAPVNRRGRARTHPCCHRSAARPRG